MERNGLNLEGEKLLQYQNAMDVLDWWMDNYIEHELISRVIMKWYIEEQK